MPESNRRHQAPEACALSAELIALKKDRFKLYHFALFVKELLFPLSNTSNIPILQPFARLWSNSCGNAYNLKPPHT